VQHPTVRLDKVSQLIYKLNISWLIDPINHIKIPYVSVISYIDQVGSLPNKNPINSLCDSQ